MMSRGMHNVIAHIHLMLYSYLSNLVCEPRNCPIVPQFSRGVV
jgi:hypothetical protein